MVVCGIRILEWGPRGLDYIERRGSPYTSEEFVELYAETVRDAIDLVPDVTKFNEGELRAGCEGLMSHMVAVVRAYNGRKGIDVNANLMLPATPTDGLLNEASFCRKDRRANSFRCFLSLEQWARPPFGLPNRIVLPVEPDRGGDALLFGAPKAYVTNQAQIINDTLQWDLAADHESQRVKLDLSEYFKAHAERFRSFVSIPIAPPRDRTFVPRAGCLAGVMGVLNIQCSRTNLLGRVTANQRKLLMVLLPLVHILSYYLFRMNVLAGESPAAPVTS